MDETPEERLRAALSAIVGRGQTARDLHSRPLPPLAHWMALEAVIGLAEAYPDDPLYRIWVSEWNAAARQPVRGADGREGDDE